MVRCERRGHTLPLGSEGSKLFYLTGTTFCCTRVNGQVLGTSFVLTMAKQGHVLDQSNVSVVGLEATKRSSSRPYTRSMSICSQGIATARSKQQETVGTRCDRLCKHTCICLTECRIQSQAVVCSYVSLPKNHMEFGICSQEKEQSFHNIRCDYPTTISLPSPGRCKLTLKKQLATKKFAGCGSISTRSRDS